MLRAFSLSLLVFAAWIQGAAQVQTGLYAFGAFDNPGFDTIDRGSLTVHFSIPIVNKPGRGMNFTYALNYDGVIWVPATSSGTTAWTPVNGNWGFSGQLGENLFGFLTLTDNVDSCRFYSTDLRRYITYYGEVSTYSYTDPLGRQHPFNLSIDTCVDPNLDNGPKITGNGLAKDGSGYKFISSLQAGTLNSADTVISPSGTLTNPPYGPSGAGTIIDSNGNQITSAGNGVFTDTTGTTALGIGGSGTSTSPHVFTYQTPTGTKSTTVYYASYTVQTSFGCSGIGEYSQTVSLVDHIVFADGSQYAFSYERSPGSQTAVTGRLQSITLPQGGGISYTYTGGSNGVSCSDGTATGIIRTTSDGTRTYVRSSITSTTSQTTITDGMNNQSVWSFVTLGIPKVFLQTQMAIYQGAPGSTALVSAQLCYNGNTSNCSTTVPSLPISNASITTTLDGIETAATSAGYNTTGTKSAVSVYDFGSSGSGSPGPLMRNEQWSYLSAIPNLITQDHVYDGSGTIAGIMQNTYDQTSPTLSSGVPQHSTANAPVGNLTSNVQYASPSTYLISTATYEDTGSVLTTSSPSKTASYSYDGTFTFVTGVTLPTTSSGISLSSSISYDAANSGSVLSFTDANLQRSSIASYDSMLRPLEIHYPDGGKTTYSYSPTSTTTSVFQNAGNYGQTIIQYDGYGRVSRTFTANGQSTNPWYQQDTCYDANGRVAFQSYRYQGSGTSSSKVCAGAGDSYIYDSLGRVTSMVRANGESQSFSYFGRATKVVDENLATRISQVDGLGRTTVVCEISSNGGMPNSGPPGSCGTDIAGTGFTTTYAYSLASGTTTVNQGGQVRTFRNDWLGRITSVTEPESGTTTYSYAYNSTGLVVTRSRPKANQSISSTLTTTTTQYDNQGRIVSVSYSDGTPTKTFAYDASAGSSFSDLTQANLKGRLSLASIAGVAGTAYSYDSLGRIAALDECLPSGCGTTAYNHQLHYTYNLAGDMLSSTDGAGVTSSYSFSPASEVQSLTSSLSNSTNPANILSSIQNGAFGPISANLGNGLTSVFGYDALGRTNGGWICGGSTSASCLGGTQVYGFTNGWNGVRLTGSSDSALSQGTTYGYDEFSRLTSRTVNSGTGPNLAWIYDRWGNRASQTASGSGSAPQPSYTINTANNQLVGFTYDAAGEMTNDGNHSYVYDAEGNITAIDGGSTAVYVYDALNHRIRTVVASTSTEFVFNANGQRVSVWNGSTRAQIRGQYYWGSKPVAFYLAGDAAQFQHQDWLGTERMRTSYNSNVVSSYISLPFGDAQNATGADNDPYHYAMLDTDSETGTDHAQFRQYSSAQGRWLTSDPYFGSYDLTNPQSLNRYTYAVNSPLAANDPKGLYIRDCDWDGGCFPYVPWIGMSASNLNGIKQTVFTDSGPFGGGNGATLWLAEQPVVETHYGLYMVPFIMWNNMNMGSFSWGGMSGNLQSSAVGFVFYGMQYVFIGTGYAQFPNVQSGNVANNGPGEAPSELPSNGWEWDESKAQWPKTSPRTQSYGTCFNSLWGQTQTLPPAVQAAVNVITVGGPVFPNPVSKWVGIVNGLYTFASRVVPTAVTCAF
jgi:RHS repeat-associated protein